MAIPSNFSRRDLIGMGRTLQGEEMLRAQNLISGKTQPWELPEWQPIIEGLRTQHERGLEDLTNAYRQADVTGPAAALGLEKAGEGYTGSLMDIANKMRGMGHPEAWEGAKMGKESGEFLTKLAEAARARREAEPSEWEKYGPSIIGGAGSAIGGATSKGGVCGCRIFTEDWTKELELPIRRFRDEHFSPDSYVSKGYAKMSHWLVPLMMKSKFVRWIVRKIMLKPMSRFAKYYYNKNLKANLYAPIGLFWTMVWDILGRYKVAIS
jgi:hypothetical protein